MVKDTPHYRADAIRAGLRRLGYTLVDHTTQTDLIVIWNRYGWRDQAASEVEARGGTVIVMENGYLGNDFAGDRWYAAALSQHNGAGKWPHHGNERWDSLGVELEPWRNGAGEPVLLPQRGIGPAGVAMPLTWAPSMLSVMRSLGIKCRVRAHPGIQTVCKPLADDIGSAQYCVTWGSGAAIKALAIGVPVFHSFDKWIGASAARHVKHLQSGPVKDDAARLTMFRRLAWAMWRVSEIESGECFKTLVELKDR